MNATCQERLWRHKPLRAPEALPPLLYSSGSVWGGSRRSDYRRFQDVKVRPSPGTDTNSLGRPAPGAATQTVRTSPSNL